MAQLGQISELTVCRISPYGAFLNGGDLGEVMLLKAAAPDTVEVGDSLQVFVYLDSDETLVATTSQPLLTAGQCGRLRVVDLTDSGAYLDWGLSADLFLPRSEQMGDTSIGDHCVVMVMVDEASSRMIASSKLYKYLPEVDDQTFKAGQAVELLICQTTDLGYRAVINNTHLGMLYHDEVFKSVSLGDKQNGFIKAIREDGKIDLVMQRPSKEARSAIEMKILEHLQKNNGESQLTDKSPPESIYKTFGVSKKVYKKALGALYKNRMIVLSKEKISLVKRG